MVSWSEIETYSKKAMDYLFKRPEFSSTVEFDEAKFGSYKFGSYYKSGKAEKDYTIYFEDKRLGKFAQGLQTLFYAPVTFYAHITEDYLNNQTKSIDLAAKIPANMPDEKKVILRIAYTIVISWQRAILNTYETVVEKDQNKWTFKNAMDWYWSLN